MRSNIKFSSTEKSHAPIWQINNSVNASKQATISYQRRTLRKRRAFHDWQRGHEDDLSENEDGLHEDEDEAEAEAGCYEAEAENIGVEATLVSRT